jgi:hypothetical protein
MTPRLGIGTMLSQLGGNAETVEAFTGALNKTIAKLYLKDERLYIGLTDATGIVLYDDAQSCCEYRHMHTDDRLEEFVGATLLNAEIKDAPDIEGGGEVHEIQFLEITTSKGPFQMVSHNEHNVYYGGFSIVVRKDP